MVHHSSFRLERVGIPASEPLSLAEAKLFLRVDGSAEDDVIATMITAVRELAEAHLHKSLVSQNWQLIYDDYMPSCITLYKGPVQEITGVETFDREGNAMLVDASFYELNARQDRLTFRYAMMAHRLHVNYVAGYGEDEDVPAAIRQGLLIHLAALYHDRLQGMALPAATKTLYQPFMDMRL